MFRSRRKEVLQIEDIVIWLPNTGMHYQTILKGPITYSNSKTIENPFLM